MKYRKFLADSIFDGYSFIPTDQVVIVDTEGVVQDVVQKDVAGDDIEILNGILTPGMINSHCHLELSYLKGKIPEHTGLVEFLLSVVALRKKEERPEEILQAIEAAENEMYRNGIVGVGDIANTAYAIEAKTKSSIRWRTFIEVLNFFDETLEERLVQNKKVLHQHKEAKLEATLTPHAPYSVSKKTFEAINAETMHLVSIHNQETAAENELFAHGTGDFLRLYTGAGFKKNPMLTSGKSSLQTYIPYFDKGQQLLLVHNTNISEADILFIKSYERNTGSKAVFCLCPNANLYIENKLPPVDLLMKHNCKMVLGTDSYSSNWNLSIAQEIKTIISRFSHIQLEMVLKWACANGADCFGWNDLGKIEKGKKPGLVLLQTNEQGITGISSRIV